MFAQGYADDGVLLVCGKFLNTVCDAVQRVLCGVERWCHDKTLSVNPNKTEMILFTRRYKPEQLKVIYFFNEELKLSQSVKYLGVILDPKLSWKAHLDSRCQKAIIAFSQLRRVMGVTWGMTPKVAYWLYTAVIRPMFCYAAVIWWSRTTYKTVGKKLEHLQRLACLYISGAVRTTPTAALEIVLGITPLSVYVKQEAMAACNRLKLAAQWVFTNCGHTLIYLHLSNLIPISRMRCDKIPTTFIFGNNYTVETPSREEWEDNTVRLYDNTVCFTDGSRSLRHTGAGFYNHTTGEQSSLPLGTLSSVFQAEMYAILQCAKSDDLHQRHNDSIVICTDSQAALRALSCPKVTSALVLETMAALRELAMMMMFCGYK